MAEIEVIFYIEGIGNDKKVLERALAETADRLRNEKRVKVEYVKVEDVIEDPNSETLPYSGMIEAKLGGTLREIVIATITYAPAVIEILSPGKMEIEGNELMKILGEVSYLMGQLMNRFGALAAYPKLEELPEPRIGYSREEIEEMIVEDRMILYRFVVEVFGDDEEEIKKNFAKALSYEGCRINKLVTKLQGERNGRKYILVATELLSTFETMLQLTAKYAPVAISIIEPEIVDVNAPELQGALADLAGFVYELVTRPVKKEIVEKETFKFKL
ncbi:hypothetical protein E3E51_03650 [Thermococcus sp. 21S7]|nr:hypothetical protein [Thermococcus sp. 21S7]NJE60847.1 hypothetical protein [Thermococcus sp. 21S7]